MSVSDQNSENRFSLMSDLLAQQDQVIQELENLDQQLLSTIEAFRASKEKAATGTLSTEEVDSERSSESPPEVPAEVPAKRAA